MQIVEKDLTIEEILKHPMEQKVLIIVNTVTKAQQLYKEFEETGVKASFTQSFYQQAPSRKGRCNFSIRKQRLPKHGNMDYYTVSRGKR